MASRREVLKAAILLPVMPAVERGLRAEQAAGPRVLVAGAGAFGGWTALELQRRGARVTLLDAWGPGNTRASSGGETRVIRATYGTRAIYTKMAARAMRLWREYDAQWQRGFFRQTGALWMFGKDDAFGRASAAALRAEGLPVDELTPKDAAARFPQISFAGISSALWEPQAGYLFARRACEHVVQRFVAGGGTYLQQAVQSPVRIEGPSLKRIAVDAGTSIEADAFVFACGPWLGTLFPDVIGARVTLLDAWGPGNTRASSGGETRVIRATYGTRAIYTKMAARAMRTRRPAFRRRRWNLRAAGRAVTREDRGSVAQEDRG